MSQIISKLVRGPRMLFQKKQVASEKSQAGWLPRVLLLWAITGGVYYLIEGLWHIGTNGGWANIVMAPIGGFCGVLVGIMNENPRFARKKMILQALYGAAVLVVVEFISGFIMNIMLGLNIWDYSTMAFNFMGQISLFFVLLWFLLVPFIIWFDDLLRHKLWDQGERYPWYQNYVKLFTFR